MDPSQAPAEVFAVQAVNQPRPPISGVNNPAYHPASLRCLACEIVPRSFHATFACQWRRYLYLLPLTQEDASRYLMHHHGDDANVVADHQSTVEDAEGGWVAIAKAIDDSITWLQGQRLDYYAFGRSTPKGRSCVCTMTHASAKFAYLPQGLNDLQSFNAAINANSISAQENADGTGVGEQGRAASKQRVPVVCIQIVADRFVRRMVRTLVATAAMSAIWNEPSRVRDALQAQERRDTAYSAPAAGLCFTGAGYDDQPPCPIDI